MKFCAHSDEVSTVTSLKVTNVDMKFNTTWKAHLSIDHAVAQRFILHSTQSRHKENYVLQMYLCTSR